MKRILTLLSFLLMFAVVPLSAQDIKDSGYKTVGHVKKDGTVQDDSYRTIGHTSGIPMEWEALFFFFLK